MQSLTDNESRFACGSRLFAGREELTVASSRGAAGFLYLTFVGHADRTSIESMRHRMLQVPEADLPALPGGEFYRYQLVDLNAVDPAGSSLGTVLDVIETGANDVLRVTTADGNEILIPFLPHVVLSVDLPAKRIVIDPPDWR